MSNEKKILNDYIEWLYCENETMLNKLNIWKNYITQLDEEIDGKTNTNNKELVKEARADLNQYFEKDVPDRTWNDWLQKGSVCPNGQIQNKPTETLQQAKQRFVVSYCKRKNWNIPLKTVVDEDGNHISTSLEPVRKKQKQNPENVKQ